MLLFKTLISFLKDKEYRDLLYTTAIVIFIGTVAYHFLEKWSWIDSLYFSVITLTTVGYGDYSPASNAGKLFTIVYIIIGIGIILAFIEAIYRHYSKMMKFNIKKKNKK